MKPDNKIKMFAVAATVLATAACTDTWDEHYGNEGRPVSDKSLLQVMEEQRDLGDFLKVLRATHVFNNNKPTNVTYADLLASDQTFTVWAPKDGQFNVDSLLEECLTVSGDSMCGQHFVQNHIAHFITNSTDMKSVLMLNNKYLDASPGFFQGVTYESGRANEAAKNGILHVLSGELPYLYNVYEALTTLSEYSGIGSFFKRYEKLELDENSSIQSGIVDGNIVYSDSVMVTTNILFSRFDRINEEDSSFIMLVPETRVWDKAYDEAQSYFNYGSVNQADSLQRLYAHQALIRDLVYNRNIGCSHMADSVYSIAYNKYDEERRHVYYKPLAAGGIFSSDFVRDTMACSNGAIYNLYEWPFNPEDIYFYPVKTEAEYESMMTDYEDCTYASRSSVADSISDGYLVISPRTNSSNWTMEFQVPDVLSGTYDVCAVVLPRTVYNASDRNFRPCKFTASISYETEDGVEQTYDFEDEVQNDPYRVDTVKIGTFTVPVCSYGQPDAKVHLTLECSISRSESGRYNREMYLDCLYFKPNREEK